MSPKMLFRGPWLIILGGGLLSLAACTSQPATHTIPDLQGSENHPLPREVAGQQLALKNFSTPSKLAGLKHDGEISSDRDGWRQWVFGAPKTRLTVTVYGLPGGWRDLPQERIVSGHYGELRQRRINRVYNSDNQSIRFTSERLFDLESRLTASASYLINQPGRQPLNEVLLLTLDNDHFVRVECASRKLKNRQLLQISKRALAEFRAHQSKHDADSQ